MQQTGSTTLENKQNNSINKSNIFFIFFLQTVKQINNIEPCKIYSSVIPSMRAYQTCKITKYTVSSISLSKKDG